MYAAALPMQDPSADRLGLALAVAVTVHAAVILGVTFVPHERSRSDIETLDVVLVQSSTDAPVEDPDFLAEADQAGGGDHDRPARPATPTPAPFTGSRPLIASAAMPPPATAPHAVARPTEVSAKPAADEPEPARPSRRPTLAQLRVPSEHRVSPVPEPTPKAVPNGADAPKRRQEAERQGRAIALDPSPEQPRVPPSAAALVSRSLQMASLNAEIEARLEAYAKRPRRKWITSRTRAHKYASYMEAWRRKVERIGNLNYPDEARRQRLSGNLLLDVALNPDGSIQDVVLRRSSGKKVLDDAAMRIVKLAAPFSKFPDSIASEVDILHIERTWQFLSDARFASR